MRLNSQDQSDRISWSVRGWEVMVFMTATLVESEEDPHVISDRWREFVKTLRRWRPGTRIIRVLQRHPGGHGWHVHALCDRILPATWILEAARMAGLGRMDFRAVDKSRRGRVVEYVSRYIARDLRKRDNLTKGVRLITAAGALVPDEAQRWWKRVSDLEVVSNVPTLIRTLVGVLATHGLRLPTYGCRLADLISAAPPRALETWRGMHPGVIA